MCVLSSTAMVMPQPMVPAVDPNQLAAQQQAFINQQAMLMVSARAQDLGKSHTLGFVPWRGAQLSPLCLLCAGMSSIKWGLFKTTTLGTLFLLFVPMGTLRHVQ